MQEAAVREGLPCVMHARDLLCQLPAERLGIPLPHVPCICAPAATLSEFLTVLPRCCSFVLLPPATLCSAAAAKAYPLLPLAAAAPLGPRWRAVLCRPPPEPMLWASASCPVHPLLPPTPPTTANPPRRDPARARIPIARRRPPWKYESALVHRFPRRSQCAAAPPPAQHVSREQLVLSGLYYVFINFIISSRMYL